MICNICPHNCSLSDGETGKCNVRTCHNSIIELDGYGRLSNIALESIEKRPFFHFHPGTKFLSVGMYGCSFLCQYCQNHKVSQVGSGKNKYYAPQDLIKLANDKNSKGIVFTYNEPTIYYEYLMDLGLVNNGLELALKSNGFASLNVIDDLSHYYKAWNVDIKGDNEEYKITCGATLQPVLDAIVRLKENNVHLEISYLVLPRQINDFKHHKRIRDWLVELSDDIPIHMLYFYPCYNMQDEQYGEQEFKAVYDCFAEKMRYVYMSNIFKDQLLEYRNTKCYNCGAVLINRGRDFKIEKKECCGGNNLIF